jgi:hypothetical protein
VEDAPLAGQQQFRRLAVAICLIGVGAQLVLTAYYLSMGHDARPRHLPVGLVSVSGERAALTGMIEKDGSFAVTDYPTATALVDAVQHREVYGGADVSGLHPTLYVATAGGAAAATALRTTYTGVIAQRTTAAVRNLVLTATPVSATMLTDLTTPPHVVDVAPLPPSDRVGASLGFLVQALALGGSIASIGLGRLIPRTRRSVTRGLVHVTILGVYAVGSSAAVLWSMSWFDVGAAGAHQQMFGSFVLVSLAITASTAGAVALIGPAGATLGFLYFTIGTVISGASILPEFLPPLGRSIGEWLPTGAGVTAVRDALYFPDASITRPLLILGVYTAVGALIVMVTNTIPNPGDGTAELDLHPGALLVPPPRTSLQPDAADAPSPPNATAEAVSPAAQARHQF